MPIKLIPPRAGKTPYWSGRGTYLGQYVDRSTKTADRRKAKRLLDKWQAEIERGEFARPGEPTFVNAAVEYMKTGGERTYVGRLLDYFGPDFLLSRMDQAAIDNAAFELYPKASPATRNRQVHTVISAILKRAKIDHRLQRPKGAAGLVKTDWLWPEQAFRLFNNSREIDPEFASLLVYLCYTGSRLSEALNLAVADVNLSESFAFVRDTKNGNPRPVFLPPVVVAELASHPRGMDRSGTLFRFRKNGRLYTLLSRTKKAAGSDLGFVNFHTFRHTWATWMRRYGGLDTAGLVGTGAWKDRKSAGRYEHVVVTEEATKAALLPTDRKAK